MLLAIYCVLFILFTYYYYYLLASICIRCSQSIYGVGEVMFYVGPYGFTCWLCLWYQLLLFFFTVYPNLTLDVQLLAIMSLPILLLQIQMWLLFADRLAVFSLLFIKYSARMLSNCKIWWWFVSICLTRNFSFYQLSRVDAFQMR